MKFNIDIYEEATYNTVSFKIETAGGDNVCEKISFDYSKLKGRIVEKFNTQSRFASENGLSDRSMSLKLNNGIGLSQEEIISWCELLEIPTEEIPLYFFNQKVSKMKHK